MSNEDSHTDDYEKTFAIHLADGTTVDGQTFFELVVGHRSIPCESNTVQDCLALCVKITRALALGHRFDVASSSSQPLPEESETTDIKFSSLSQLVDAMEKGSGGVLLLHTSGTTGRPKSVQHEYHTLSRGIKRSSSHRQDLWATGFTPAHMAGIQVFLQALANGNPLLFLRGLAPEKIYAKLDQLEITHISATPTFYRMLPLAINTTLPRVRHLTSGGESWDPSLPSLLKKTFPNAVWHNIYATTEAGSLFISQGDTFRLRSEWNGLVEVRNGQLHLSRQLLGDMPIEEDWYPTGDLVEKVSEDPLEVRFIRRENEEINIAGYKINPHDVERVLRQHPEIQNARVYARENKVTGKLLMADIIFRGPALPDKELRNFLSRELDTYHIPRICRSVSHLEETASGKMIR